MLPLLCILTALFLVKSLPGQITVVNAGRMLDIRNERVLEWQSILIEGDRIREVRPTPEFTPPPNAKILDLSRATVLPGLIDAHTHLLHEEDLRHGFGQTGMLLEVAQVGAARRALLGAKFAREVLNAGITTVRDLGNSGVNGDVALRDAIAAGWVPGPRMMVSTRAISPIGGQFNNLRPESKKLIAEEYIEVSGVEEARRAVRQGLFDGADCVKIIVDVNMRMLTPDEIKAIVDEAHRLDKGGYSKRPVAAHAVSDAAIRAAVEAGVDSVEHGYGVSEATLKLMAEKKTYLVLTEESERDPLLPLIGQIAALWELPKRSEEQTRHYRESRKRTIRRAFELGVPVVFGSDRYIRRPGLERGTASLLGLAAYAEAGVKPWSILRSATVTAADLLGWSNRVGSIQTGVYADLIAVQGDPVSDISALQKAIFVMKGGQIVHAAGH